MVEMSGVENFMIKKSGFEKFILPLGLNCLGLKLGVEKSGDEMSFNPLTAPHCRNGRITWGQFISLITHLLNLISEAHYYLYWAQFKSSMVFNQSA